MNETNEYAQKALGVLIEQAKTKAEIASCSKLIGDSLESCRVKNQTENSNFDPHLFEAYKQIIIEDDWGDAETVYRTNEQSAQFLKDCPYCLAAHRAVQDRKKWKKRLATLRGAATKIGLAGLAKESENVHILNK